MTKRIGIASDHAGFEMKEFLIGLLLSEGYAVKDYGCNSNESVDYPIHAHALAQGLNNDEYDMGIALCGSANGMIMTLNKYQNIRAALCWTPEIVTLARTHNDANICALPARFIDNLTASDIVDKFLSTDFEGGRHQNRIDLIPVR